VNDSEGRAWLHSMIFLIKIYLPLCLFALAVFKISTGRLPAFRLWKALYLFAAFWLFNEFAYEAYLFAHAHLFRIAFLFFHEEARFLCDSFLCMCLLLFYFIGYATVLIRPLQIMEKNGNRGIQMESS